jgi:restriction system protein
MIAKVPPYDHLFNAVLRAIHSLGGSGSIEEIYDKVVELEKFPEEVISQLHDPEKSNQTQLGYRPAWARTYLKKYGSLDNSSRGIWSLTPNAKDIETVDAAEVVRAVRSMDKKPDDMTTSSESLDSPQILDWRQRLHNILTHKLRSLAWG